MQQLEAMATRPDEDQFGDGDYDVVHGNKGAENMRK